MTARGSWWGVALGACLLISTPRPGLSAPADNPPEKRVTVNIRDKPLREVLQEVSGQTGLLFRVEPDVPDIHLNLSIRDITPEMLVRLLLRQASNALGDHSITHQVKKNVYVVKLGPPEIRQDELPAAKLPVTELVEPSFQDPRLQKKLTMKVTEEPFGELLVRIFQRTGVSYELQPALRSIRVTLAVKDVTALTAARLAVRQLGHKLPGANLWRRNGVYIFGVAVPSSDPTDQP